MIHPQKSTAQRRCVTSAVRKDEVIDSWQLGSKEIQVEPKSTPSRKGRIYREYCGENQRGA